MAALAPTRSSTPMALITRMGPPGPALQTVRGPRTVCTVGTDSLMGPGPAPRAGGPRATGFTQVQVAPRPHHSPMTQRAGLTFHPPPHCRKPGPAPLADDDAASQRPRAREVRREPRQ